MAGFELRPLSLGELLDRAFLLYRRNFWLFAGIIAIPLCLAIPLQFSFLRAQGAPFPLNKPTPLSQFPAYTLVLWFVYSIAYAIGQAATTYAVADAYLGRPSTIREAYGKIRGHYGRLAGVTFGVGIRICGMVVLAVLASTAVGIAVVALTRARAPQNLLIGSITLVSFLLTFAAVIFGAVRYAVSLPAALLEDVTGGAAIRRSVQLSKGRRGQLFVAMLLGVVVVYAVTLLFQGPFYAAMFVIGIKGRLPLWFILSMSMSSLIGAVIAGPLLMIILVLSYYDLRIRKEGFDLQHMITSLPEPEAAGSPAVS